MPTLLDLGTGMWPAGQRSTSTLGNLGRSRFVDELADPRVRDRLIAYTRAEVGGQGREAQQAFMESILNRALARNQPLARTLSGSYFPQVTHQRAGRPVSEAERVSYSPLIADVMGGSNIANYATGNASGTVGFAGGPQTAAFGGERYGIEGPDRGWWTRIGVAGPSAGGGVGYTAQYSPPATAVAPPSPPERSWGDVGLDFLSGLQFTPARSVNLDVAPLAFGTPQLTRLARR